MTMQNYWLDEQRLNFGVDSLDARTRVCDPRVHVAGVFKPYPWAPPFWLRQKRTGLKLITSTSSVHCLSLSLPLHWSPQFQEPVK